MSAIHVHKNIWKENHEIMVSPAQAVNNVEAKKKQKKQTLTKKVFPFPQLGLLVKLESIQQASISLHPPPTLFFLQTISYRNVP